MCRLGRTRSLQKSTREGPKSGVVRHERLKRGRGMNDRDERSRGIEIRTCVFIITDKAKASRGGGKRCRCYERRRAKV